MVYWKTLLGALASVVKGSKVNFELNFAGSTGLGKSRFFEPIVDALGPDHARQMANAQFYFGRPFDAAAEKVMLTVLDEIGIPSDSPMRPLLRSRITSDMVDVEGKGKDAKMRRNRECFVNLAETQADMDLNDRRSFFCQCLDILSVVTSLGEKDEQNIRARQYLTALNVEINDPGFKDQLLTYLQRYEDAEFNPNEPPERTTEHAHAAMSAKPIEHRWAWAWLHDDIQEEQREFYGDQLPDVHERFRSSSGYFDIAARKMSQFVNTWCDLERGTRRDSEQGGRDRFRDHELLEAALNEATRASPVYRRCWMESNVRVRRFKGYSKVEKTSGDWYQFNVTDKDLKEKARMESDHCGEDDDVTAEATSDKLEKFWGPRSGMLDGQKIYLNYFT